MSKPQIAIQFHPQHADYDTIRRQVVAAEQMGVDTVYKSTYSGPVLYMGMRF